MPAIEAVAVAAESLLVFGYDLGFTHSKGPIQEHDAIHPGFVLVTSFLGSLSRRISGIVRSVGIIAFLARLALQEGQTLAVRTPAELSRLVVVGVAATAALTKRPNEDRRDHVTIVVPHFGLLREAGVPGDVREGPLDAGGQQVLAVGADIHEGEHAGLPEKPRLLPRRQLCDLAGRVVLEESRIALILHQKRNCPRGRFLLARALDYRATGHPAGDRFRAPITGNQQRDHLATGRPLHEVAGATAETTTRRDGGVNRGIRERFCGAGLDVRDPDLSSLRQVGEESNLVTLGRPDKVGNERVVRQVDVEEGPRREGIDLKPDVSVGIEPPFAVGLRPELEACETVRLLRHLLERRPRVRQGHDEMVAVGAEVVEAGVPGIASE